MMPSTRAAPTPINTFFQVFMNGRLRPSCQVRLYHRRWLGLPSFLISGLPRAPAAARREHAPPTQEQLRVDPGESSRVPAKPTSMLQLHWAPGGQTRDACIISCPRFAERVRHGDRCANEQPLSVDRKIRILKGFSGAARRGNSFFVRPPLLARLYPMNIE